MPPLKTSPMHVLSNNNSSSASSPGEGTNSTSSSGTTAGVGSTTTSSQQQQQQSHQLNNKKCAAFMPTRYSQKLLLNFETLRDDSRFCDVEIIAGGTIINAHRIILSAASAYFEAMFRPAFGLNEGKQKSVILYSIDPDILKLLLDFIYTGKIYITQANVQELLAAADMLQIPEVVEGCCDFLCRELHASNALGILRFAEAHHCEQLAQSAQTFIYTHFPQVAAEDEILDAPQSLLTRILTSEWLRVDSESQVFAAALRWITHDVYERRQFVFDILLLVRLALVPIRIIDQQIYDCRDLSLRVALHAVRKDLILKRGQLVPLRPCPRTYAKKCIYIFGGTKRESTANWNNVDCIFASVTRYDIFRREWFDDVEQMHYGRIQPGVATVGGKIFVIGGERDNQILANGEVYDPQNNKWSVITPMITPRCEFGLCALGGTLWAVGGWIGLDIGGSMECYDPVKDTWEAVGGLPEPRFSMGVVSFEGLIYVVGGCTTSSRHLADLICYNPITREWSSLAPMKTARCQLGVAILNRYLYVVGGSDYNQDNLKTIERYNFDDNQWEFVCPMSAVRASPAVASADGLLYVAGGDQTCEENFYRAQKTISSAECYDPLTDTWVDCPDLLISRSEAGAVAL